MSDNTQDDYEDDWSDDDVDFDDDFDQSGFEGMEEPEKKPAKSKGLLVMGGAVVAISMVGGYLLKDIFIPQQNAVISTPATDAQQTAQNDPLLQQAQQQPAINANNTMPTPLDGFEAQNASNIISDDDFGAVDGAADIGASTDDPFAQFAPVPVDTAQPDDGVPVVPFDTPNTGDPADETVINVENIAINDLTSTAEMDTPQPVEPQETAAQNEQDYINSILNEYEGEAPEANTPAPVEQVETAPVAPATPPVNTGMAQNSDTILLERNLERAETEISSLKQTIEDMNSQISNLQNELEQARTAQPGPTPAAVAEPAPSVAAVSSAPAAPATERTYTARVDIPDKPTLPPRKTWMLRAADTSEAAISQSGSDALVMVKVGDMVPGYGRVQAIHWSGESGWQVLTTGGRITQ